MCTRRGLLRPRKANIAAVQNGKYAAVTRGRPAFQRHEAHAEGSDTTPMQERRKSTVCRREQRVRRHRAPTLRKPFFCRNKPRAGLFRHSHSDQRVVISPPHRSAEKNVKWEFLSPPPTGLPPKPSKAVSVGRGRATERASPAACGGMRDSSSARTTASIAFVWSAAKPLPCQMHWAGHGPTPPSCGQKPTPTQSCERFCGNAFTRLRRRSFKVGPVPL